jgi:hypothetical protein
MPAHSGASRRACPGFTRPSCILALALFFSAGSTVDGSASAAELKDMTGCWVTKEAAATSLETDSTKPDAVKVVFEKMLLMFERMENTEHLVLGHIYEWDESTVLGPQYQNGVFDPVAKNLTFGFPEGGLDTVYSLDRDTLLYVHKKSSTVSAMSVRPMSRLACSEAKALERELLGKKKPAK